MKKCFILLFVSSCLCLPSSLLAEPQWVLQVGTGSAYSFPTPLTISQDGQKDINMTAEYDTRAWGPGTAPYYNIKLAKWEDGSAWELETHHHKLYLSNKPPEVQKFAISHGYNLNTLNRAWLDDGLIYRVGGGFVMTHPETEVRGKRHEDSGGFNGFYISGVTTQFGIEKRYPLSKTTFYSFELKATASYAEIPIGGGKATVPNAAVHGIFSFGYLPDF